MDFDLSDFKALSASVSRASAALVAAEAAVVKRALNNIKTETREGVSTNPTWKRLASTVTYDQSGLAGIVGYRDEGQGELASIAEYGSARHAPHPALVPAARNEAPRFEKAALNAALDVIGKAL